MTPGSRLAAAILLLSALEVGASSSISRVGCGESKLCVENPESCDPNGPAPCLFTSISANQSELSVSLRGESSGYIALGLANTSQGGASLFLCVLNDSDVFFRSVLRNDSDADAPFVPLNLDVMRFVGVANGSAISCTFSVPLSDISGLSPSNDTVFSLILGSGGVANDSSLGALNVSRTTERLDLVKFKNESSTTAAPQTTTTATTAAPSELSISRSGCGLTKLCLDSPRSCDPSGSGSCLFTSVTVHTSGSELNFSLRGDRDRDQDRDSGGYVALGLFNSSQDVVLFFVCGQRNGSFFFQTAQRNNSVTNGPLTNHSTSVEGVEGEVKGNVTRCVFKIRSSDLRTRTRTGTSTGFVFEVILGTGAVSGEGLGSLTDDREFGAVDLSDPEATPAPPTATPAPGRAVYPTAGLSALILPLLLSAALSR